MSSEHKDAISREQAIYFRNKLRAARDAALRDSEGYQQVLFALEQMGRQWCPRKNSIGDLEDYFTKLVGERDPFTGRTPWGMEFAVLYKMMRDGRNDAMHVGAVARRLTVSCVRIAISLEDVLVANTGTLPFSVRDYMISTPVRTYGWQRIGLIRQTMLENSFSHLPFLKEYNGKREPEWHIVSADAICWYLESAEGNSRKSKLARKLDEVCCEGDECPPDRVKTRRAKEVDLDASKHDVLSKICGDMPVLVTRQKELVGILNAFDLM